MDDEMTALSRSLVVELAGSIGLRDSRLAQGIIWPLFRPVTNRLARIGLAFDRNEAQTGFSKAMGIALQDFASSVAVRGNAEFPLTGPLLVISNHPGTYDSLVIASQLQRDDLNFISGDIPFLRKLPHAYRHFFCISDQDNGRTVAARKAIRHLQGGGAMLLYGYGHIDPDPAVYNDAPGYIDRWSPSIDLFLRAVPETRILITIVSHVVALKWRNSLLHRLRSDPQDRRRLVEFGQVIHQLLFPHKLMTAPRVSFGPPLGIEEIRRKSGIDRVLPAVIARGKALLREHMEWVKSSAVEQHPAARTPPGAMVS
jgi:hypothetical protein